MKYNKKLTKLKFITFFVTVILIKLFTQHLGMRKLSWFIGYKYMIYELQGDKFLRVDSLHWNMLSTFLSLKTLHFPSSEMFVCFFSNKFISSEINDTLSLELVYEFCM